MAEDDTSYLERKQKRQHQIFLGRCFEDFEPERHSHKTWSLSLSVSYRVEEMDFANKECGIEF